MLTEEQRLESRKRTLKKYGASQKNKDVQKRYYEKNKEKLYEKTKKWALENKDRIKEYNKKSTRKRVDSGKINNHRTKLKENNPEKLIAKDAANNAVKRGSLKRKLNCEICNKDGLIHKHHDDYSKPLEVRWLCPQCHKDVHKGIIK